METVVECVDIEAMLVFCTEELGCRVELITPADDPAEYVVAGHGARLRLVRSETDRPVRLRLSVDHDPGTARRELCAPNGTVVELVPLDGAIAIAENTALLEGWGLPVTIEEEGGPHGEA